MLDFKFYWVEFNYNNNDDGNSNNNNYINYVTIKEKKEEIEGRILIFI